MATATANTTKWLPRETIAGLSKAIHGYNSAIHGNKPVPAEIASLVAQLTKDGHLVATPKGNLNLTPETYALARMTRGQDARSLLAYTRRGNELFGHTPESKTPKFDTPDYLAAMESLAKARAGGFDALSEEQKQHVRISPEEVFVYTNIYNREGRRINTVEYSADIDPETQKPVNAKPRTEKNPNAGIVELNPSIGKSIQTVLQNYADYGVNADKIEVQFQQQLKKIETAQKLFDLNNEALVDKHARPAAKEKPQPKPQEQARERRLPLNNTIIQNLTAAILDWNYSVHPNVANQKKLTEERENKILAMKDDGYLADGQFGNMVLAEGIRQAVLLFSRTNFDAQKLRDAEFQGNQIFARARGLTYEPPKYKPEFSIDDYKAAIPALKQARELGFDTLSDAQKRYVHLAEETRAKQVVVKTDDDTFVRTPAYAADGEGIREPNPNAGLPELHPSLLASLNAKFRREQIHLQPGAELKSTHAKIEEAEKVVALIQEVRQVNSEGLPSYQEPAQSEIGADPEQPATAPEQAPDTGEPELNADTEYDRHEDGYAGSPADEHDLASV
ncbi:hypothetical protein OH491_23560 [Termitidicoccus mucosus]|uniref:Uncharacterized protein n=1 Tax=Termitidicoccus mucosus TaxID=1184151 RepID=A0A178IQ71_9BACT|nr:hypothetical protein AW736_02915 [Opitutaceae bacterium TSB47]